MGNLFQRLFNNESRESGCKRPFSKHNKVSLNENNGKSKSRTASTEDGDEPVLFRKSFKSPSVHNIHSVNLNEPSIDQSISQESPSSHAQPAAQENGSESVLPSSTPSEFDQQQHEQIPNPEPSPFQRDFLPPHQPLVSLEKARPRRSNIRRSSRMHTSMGKGDNMTRPSHLHQQHVPLQTVPSFIGDDNRLDQSSFNVVSNQDDPTLPVSHHANQNVSQWEEQRKDSIESEPEEEPVDELSPNERHKVAKSRISQLFIKREQQQQHKTRTTSALVESDGGESTPETRNSNGYVINTDYGRPVYESIDNYGHYMVSDINKHEEEHHHHRSTELHGGSGDNEHDQSKATSDNHDDQTAEESSSKPEVVPRRKPKMMHGNPLLIDELKKRQSTLYQPTAD